MESNISGGVLFDFFRVYLTNCIWENNLMNGFYTSYMTYFEVDNLTINHDPQTPMQQISPRRGFQLVNAKEIVLKNSVFQNNQNYMLLNFYNIPRTFYYNDITKSYVTFENITVLNNSAVYYDADSAYFSLFIIYAPMKPVDVLFKNSYFYNNTNCI